MLLPSESLRFVSTFISYSYLLLQAVSMGELYGEINKLTMEWRDGLMAVTVRVCVQVRCNVMACDMAGGNFSCMY